MPLTILVDTPVVSQQGNPSALLALVLIVVCIVRRKDAIGGSLLWVLRRAVIDWVFTIVAIVMAFRNFYPASWHDPKLHLIYVLSRPPEFLAAIVLALVAIESARDRDVQALRRLQIALAVRAAIGA